MENAQFLNDKKTNYIRAKNSTLVLYTIIKILRYSSIMWQYI